MLQELVRGHAEKEAKQNSDSMKLTRLSDSDDIESYLTTFERLMKADTARWAFKLAPQLTGRAQQAYAALEPTDAECYATVKAAILRRYNINDETYRQRFRSTKFRAGQTPTEVATRHTGRKNWDELLPYLLFAYREVPQVSTGFSPFKLVYGRPVRGPLDILRETWESSPRSSESVVMLMQERLAYLRDLVKTNLEH